MAKFNTPAWLKAHVADLARVACDLRGVPDDVVERASAATLAAFADRHHASERVRARSRTYFWRVAARGLVRRKTHSQAVSRLVVATVVEDLVSCGRDRLAVWRELERGWADKVPSEILEEYRSQLCA